jgi:protein-disulfide isomerase
VKLIWKHFPLDVHPKAKEAAEAVWCAQKQGRGFDMGSKLFDTQKEWATRGPESIVFAQSIGLNTKDFAQCLASDEFLEKLDADLVTAVEYNVNGTPAILIGGTFVSGVIDEETLKTLIEVE